VHQVLAEQIDHYDEVCAYGCSNLEETVKIMIEDKKFPTLVSLDFGATKSREAG
jgi:hypothetical protein